MTPERWREIEELYHAARLSDPQRRLAILECSDPEIRARVELMLAVDSTGQVLDRPPASLSGPVAEPSVAPGVQLGPYQIEGPIGAGGMGVVYRGTDTRLGRTVAIKVGSQRYSERFQTEAQAISTLNHPHVCTLYDVGPDYLVMEFIEGSTLAEEISKGPLAPERVARYGAEIAGALAEAHARGIVHCDLKPANIMLTRHGVKVLDFGLAKLLSAGTARESGAVMGTPAYMAPEQAQGKEPDALSDLFSLGLILREMATGRRLEDGPISGRLATLIAKLLERDPARRPQSAAQVAAELAALPEPRRRPALLIAAIAAVILAVASIAIYRFMSRGPVAVKYTQLTDFTDSAVAPALSPDGRMVAFIRGGNPFTSADQVYAMALPGGEARRLTQNSQQKYGLAFSPDGSRVAYTAFEIHSWNTYTIPVSGGDPRLLLQNAAGLNWIDEQHLLFSRISSGMHMGIVTGTDTGERIREVYFPAPERGMAHYSYPSPDHRRALVVEMDGQGIWGQCRLISLDGSTVSSLVGPRGSCRSAGWSPDGSWMYFTADVNNSSHLWRQRFPRGQPEQITFGPTQEDGVAVDRKDGSVITSVGSYESAIWIHAPEGERALSSEGKVELYPAPVFGPGARVLYYLLQRGDAGPELWRTTVATGRSEPVLPGIFMKYFDVSPDEKQVVYSTSAGTWVAPMDRSVPPTKIEITGANTPHFGLRGRILFLRAEGSFNYLEEINPDGSGRRKVVPFPVGEIENISPGRRWVDAVVPFAEGQVPGVMAIPVDGGSPRHVCVAYCVPTWSVNGRYLFFTMEEATAISPGRSLAVPVGPGEDLSVLPARGITPHSDPSIVPGAQSVMREYVVPGADPSHYAWVNTTVHSNLYRISVPGG